ncbi:MULTISPECIES: cysteine synthase A [Sorangium]|uniref:Cysteine synthase n=1 Tax=Sorangium cellulosum TaxID=56 RepID=A0A4P2R1W9_SORCE|nr:MULTISPECIES: cysteine synthase A [Sorangium]AUX36658.1 cysteine synthase [Sorangium cellulosum]WCQ95956.1 O-acetylserine sulfhydrylase [Sorangium sp. Soce836]
MGSIFDNIAATIGRTPLVRLSSAGKGLRAELIGKVESRNPGGSVKDRIGLAMIEDAERRGKLTHGSVLVEPTSGNTGLALAMLAAAKGYRLILTMPESMSPERVALLRAFGVEVLLTPGSLMVQAVARARQIVEETPGAVMLQQFENPANPAAHRMTTAREIWEDTDGAVDVVVAGVGTGGTITGVGEVLKEKKPGVKMIAVEPKNAAVLSGGRVGAHLIQGIGAGFVPKILRRELIDEVVPVTEDESFDAARRLAKTEGILVGISGGAAMAAALSIAARDEMQGKKIVVILPDGGERYVTSPLFKELVGCARGAAPRPKG